MSATTVTIPNRPVFRAQEVCEVVEIQPYVLRTWEAEFPELGVSKSPTGPRVYRRADIERVFASSIALCPCLKLSGARRRLAKMVRSIVETPAAGDADVAAMIYGAPAASACVRRGLNWILDVRRARTTRSTRVPRRLAPHERLARAGTLRTRLIARSDRAGVTVVEERNAAIAASRSPHPLRSA